MTKAEATQIAKDTLRSQPHVLDFGLGGCEQWVNGSCVVVDREVLMVLTGFTYPKKGASR